MAKIVTHSQRHTSRAQVLRSKISRAAAELRDLEIEDGVRGSPKMPPGLYEKRPVRPIRGPVRPIRLVVRLWKFGTRSIGDYEIKPDPVDM